MKILMLTLSAILGIAYQAQAITCVFSADGESVTITGEGEESFSNCPKDSVNYPGNKWKASVKNVEFGEGVTEIAAMAFYYSSAEYISMPYVKTMGGKAIWGSVNLKTLDMPSIQEIEGGETFSAHMFVDYLGLPADATVRVNVGYGSIKAPSCRIENGYKICGTCDDYVKSGTGCVKNCGKGYLGKEGKCINSALGCGTNYKDMGGFCNRVRYTPAEAAEIAKDDGNVVTITFRK